MSINFNIIKKNKKPEEEKVNEEEVEEIIEDEIEDEVEETSKKKSYGFDPKKKMIKYMAIIFILFIISTLSPKKSKTYSYSEIESVLVKAAKSYFKDHSNYLPEEEGDIVEVDHTNLVAENKMRDLSYYTSESCTASVKVEKSSKDYMYVPNLDCGDKYSTVPLYQKILNDNDTVTSGYGLYSIKDDHVFRGELVDNYVSIDDSLWRIVRITSSNNVVLVSQLGTNYSQPWDNRYNEDARYESGKNVYSTSRLKEYLDKVYDAKTGDKDYFISNSTKSKLVSYNLCIGKRKIDSESKDNSEECLETYKNQKFGILTLSDYLLSSIDPNCKSASSKSCKNYNYLVIKDAWWLVTASKDSSTKAFMVGTNGTVKEEYTNNYANIRPVIYLDQDVMYKSGKGTLEKPYKIR